MLDETPRHEVDVSQSEATRDAVKLSTDHLGHFLSRPVKIASYRWDVGTHISESLNPWELFLTDTLVQEKMKNFALLRGDLTVKVILNGNQYYYSRAMLSYQPLHTYDDFRDDDEFRGNLDYTHAHMSHLQHIILNPTVSGGGQLTLPMLWFNNEMSIVRQDYVNLGKLHLSSIVPLQHALAGTEAVSVIVLAYMENPKLSMPTNLLSGDLSPESGRGQGKWKKMKKDKGELKSENDEPESMEVDTAVTTETTETVPFKVSVEMSSIQSEDSLANVPRYVDTCQMITTAKKFSSAVPATCTCGVAVEVRHEVEDVVFVLYYVPKAVEYYLTTFFHYLNGKSRPFMEAFGDLGMTHPYPDKLKLHWNIVGNEISILRVETRDVKMRMCLSMVVSIIVGVIPSLSCALPEAGDEHTTKKMNQISTTLMTVGNTLASVPMFAPYETALTMASKLGQVAKIFGHSRPTQLEETTLYTPSILPRLASTDLRDTSELLTVDSKQGLSIDPRIVGSAAGDELAINSLASKQTYITQFPWSTQSVNDDLLFQIDVTPSLWTADETIVPRQTRFVPSASCLASIPFEYWHGSMKYRILVVASTGHKGRLRIVYDPEGFVNGDDAYNANFTQIVDIAEKSDFTFEVGWGNHRGYCLTDDPAARGSVEPHYSTIPRLPPGQYANGQIRVYAMTSLTTPSPETPDTVSVLVYAGAGETFSLQSPSEKVNGYTFFPESGSEETWHDQMKDEGDKPSEADGQMCTLDKPSDYDLVYFGEKVLSLRTLLKRYSVHRMRPLSRANQRVERIVESAFPLYPEFGPVETQLGGSILANMTLLNFLTPCFAARRGGIRRKFRNVSINTGLNTIGGTLACKRMAIPALGSAVVNPIDPDDDGSFLFNINYSSGIEGIAVTDKLVQPTLQVTLPMQLPVRFVPGRLARLCGGFAPGDDVESIWKFWTTFQIIDISDSAGSVDTHLEEFVSAAEDFSLSHYIGAPPMYYKGALTGGIPRRTYVEVAP